MRNSKMVAAGIILGLFVFGLCQIQDALSRPSNAQARAEAIKARLLLKQERILDRFGRGRLPDPPSIGSWQPIFCATTCPNAYTSPSSSSFIDNGGQRQLQLQLGTYDTSLIGGCTSNRVGGQINLPAGTQAGELSFDKFIDFESPPNSVALGVYVYDPNGNFIAFGDTPKQVSGSKQTFDLLNMQNGLSAPQGSVVSTIILRLRTFPLNNGGGGTYRVANVRVNGLLVEDAILQTSCPPDF